MNDVSQTIRISGTQAESPLHANALQLPPEDAAKLVLPLPALLSTRLLDPSAELESVAFETPQDGAAESTIETVAKSEGEWEDGGELAALLFMDSFKRLGTPPAWSRPIGTLRLRLASDLSVEYAIHAPSSEGGSAERIEACSKGAALLSQPKTVCSDTLEEEGLSSTALHKDAAGLSENCAVRQRLQAEQAWCEDNEKSRRIYLKGPEEDVAIQLPLEASEHIWSKGLL